MSEPAKARQRIDKWLWFARIVKSRTLAAKLVTEGRIRVNSARIETPAKVIGPGDVLTIALERDVKVLRILANGERRGPYSEARLLYEDISATGAARPIVDPSAM
ncbi:MAG: RNA-binding S4 domain-containing protein [Methylobacteriaceae bacterium]|nr:RNA-binding S4 domain-containing protein [Methylobacteriaceae bacterium]